MKIRSPVLRPGFFCAPVVWLDPEAIGGDAGMFFDDPGGGPRDRLFAEGGADGPFGEAALVADKLVGILQIRSFATEFGMRNAECGMAGGG